MNERELMGADEQETLTQSLNLLFKRFRDKHNISPIGILYFLVSYTWGWARGCGWNSRYLNDYSQRAYEACDKRERHYETLASRD